QTSVLLIVAGAIVLGILLAFRPRPGRGEGVGNRPFELRKGDVVFLPAGVYRVANAAPLQEVLVTVTADGPNGRSLVVEKARIERIVGSSGGAPRNRISS
ncbi:MAG TPA: hypothetical protein VKW04_10610, partial [Planctomycetota bacterium]|nr:hypothetical protein [Planctomycetota bacterium]